MADLPRPALPAPPLRRRRLIRPLVLIGLLLAFGAFGWFAGMPALCRLGVDLGACPPRPESLSVPAADRVATGEQGWRGAFRLPRDNGAELDLAPPVALRAANGELDHGDLFFDNRRGSGNALYTADHPLAVWRSNSPPDITGCADALTTADSWSADPVPGQVLCVQSTEGQIAALTVTAVDGDAVGLDVVVWG